MGSKKNLYPIIKVASTCNLQCSYCSADDYMNHQRDSIMTREVLRRTIEELGRVRDRGTFLWHGGEALLAGRSFFEEIVTIQRELGLKRYKNAVQTNGILMSDDWAEFLKDEQFQVGISIDGPEAMHNELRVFRNGAGSYKQVMRAVKLLEDHQRSFGVLVVITRQSVMHGEKIFDFLIEHSIKSFDFKPCYGDPRYDVSLIEFAQMLCRVFDRLVALDDPDIHIRTLEGFIKNLLGGNSGLCSQTGNCTNLITIDHDGEVYPCDRFIEPRFRFGNIMETPLDELWQDSEGANRFRELVAEQRIKCASCSYAPVCKSGCTQEIEYWPDEYCEHRAIVIDHIRDWLFSKGEEPISVNLK